MWKDTSPAGGGEQLRRPGCGLRVVRATLQRSQPSPLGPERLGTTRASALPRAGPSVAAAPLINVGRSARSHDKLQAKRTEPSRNHPGAIGSRGRIAKHDFIVAHKLEAKRTEPSRNHPGAVGSRGRIAKYDFIVVDKL